MRAHRVAEALLDAIERLIEPFAVHWLDQIVHRADFERLQCELVVRRDKHDDRRSLMAEERLSYLDAAAPGHADVEKDEIRSFALDGRKCFVTVGAVADDAITRAAREQ